MRNGEPGPGSTRGPVAGGPLAAGGPDCLAAAPASRVDAVSAGCVIETVVSPFHCLYNDALHFHTQSKLALASSEGEASRMARAALVLYVAAVEALVHQAAVELGRPDLNSLLADPARPLPLADVWRLLPAILAEGPAGPFRPDLPPWPQFAELIDLRTSWAYPGPPAARRAYYRAARPDADYDPVLPHQASALGLSPERMFFPKTGLPRDPYALRPRHLDTARGVLDAAVEALDRRLCGALTRDQRHRREPVRRFLPGE